MSSPSIVTVHPLVLLSTVDHFYRVAKDTNKRVVGVLLGEVSKGKIDVTNSYAVPFEEDPKTPSIWFLDHNFHENMFAMFKKVSANENVVGWYSTGPKIRPNDLDINEVFRRYVPNPVFVIIDVQPTELGIPSKAYVTVEELKEDGKTKKLEFKHVPSEIGAFEAEEVGVEHLLRDIKDTTISTLASSIHEKLLSLRSLRTHLEEMRDYLVSVVDGKLPVNQQILSQVQDIFNLLPGVTDPEVIRSMSVKTNDMMVVIYLASLVRSVLALHNLINNKLANREQEKKAEGGGKKVEKKDAADKNKDAAATKDTKEGTDKGKEGDKPKEKK